MGGNYLLAKAFKEAEDRKRAKNKLDMDKWKSETGYNGFDNMKIREAHEKAKDMKKDILWNNTTTWK